MNNKCYISGKGTQVSCAPSRLSSFKQIANFLAKLHCNMYRCCTHSCMYSFKLVFYRTASEQCFRTVFRTASKK